MPSVVAGLTAVLAGAVPVVVELVVGASAAGVRPARGLGLGARLGGGQQPLDGGRLVDHGGPYEVLVEHHGGELFVRAPRSWSSSGSQPSGNGVPPTSSGTHPE